MQSVRHSNSKSQLIIPVRKSWELVSAFIYNVEHNDNESVSWVTPLNWHIIDTNSNNIRCYLFSIRLMLTINSAIRDRYSHSHYRSNQPLHAFLPCCLPPDACLYSRIRSDVSIMNDRVQTLTMFWVRGMWKWSEIESTAVSTKKLFRTWLMILHIWEFENIKQNFVLDIRGTKRANELKECYEPHRKKSAKLGTNLLCEPICLTFNIGFLLLPVLSVCARCFDMKKYHRTWSKTWGNNFQCSREK